MRATGALTVFGFVLIAVGAGCDWRVFDDLKNDTPVAAIGAPSDYPAGDDFGPILLPLAPPADGSAAGRFIATATHRMSVAVISFDPAGRASGVGVTGTAFDLLAQGPITAIAEIPGTRQVLLGAPAETLGTVLKMDIESPHATTTFQNLLEAQYGVGVGAGDLGGGAAPELVVASSEFLHVYLDGVPTAEIIRMSAGATDACPIAFSAMLPETSRLNRPVIVASLLGGAAKQIAVGTPATTGSGHVSIFDVDLTTGTFTCAAVLTGAEARFGQAMTLVDIDGDAAHQPDHLLVGAPPTHAYLYALPLSTGQAPGATAMDMETGGSFGAAVAAFDIDGNRGDEIFVGNPDGSVGGTTTAGRVSVYAGAALTPLPAAFPNPLAQHEPKAGAGYGSGIAGMTFCPGNVVSAPADGGTGTADAGAAPCTRLPLVGSLSKVYAYFTLKKPDPRLK